MKEKKVINKYAKYAATNRHMLEDPALSWAAKGLYAYMESKGEDYDYSIVNLMKSTRNGRDNTLTVLRELESEGYIQKTGRKDIRMWIK